MKRLAIICLLFSGCNSVRNFVHPGREAASVPQGLAASYQVTGTTSVDYQMIEPVRVAGSLVQVFVTISGTERQLNQYEFGTTEDGVGGGGIWFKHKVDMMGTSLVVSSVCSAPIGTTYRIVSTLK